MQQDPQYPASSAPQRASGLGMLVVWSLVVLFCVLSWSALIAGIVTMWRVIL